MSFSSIRAADSAKNNTDAGPPKKPLFISASELLTRGVTVRRLVGRLIERECTGQMFGPSGGGKTFVALDMSISVACGREWNGHQCEQGLVLMFAGEGHHGLIRRIAAHRAVSGGLDLSGLYISTSAIAFDEDALRKVIADVRALETTTGRRVALSVIDTLARAIVGDENTAQGMGQFVGLVDHLRNAFPGSSALIIHHSGSSPKAQDRSRGSTALKAACDFEINIAKGQVIFTKVKDGVVPPPTEFKLVPVEVGVDDEGEPITSCVVSYGEHSARTHEEPLNKGEQALFEMIQKRPEEPCKDVRNAFIALRLKLDPKAKRDSVMKAYNRALDGLIAKGKISTDGDYFKTGHRTSSGQNPDMSGRTHLKTRMETDALLEGCPDVQSGVQPGFSFEDEFPDGFLN